MKIGITCYPTYGGSGTVATELGRALARRGHHVHFITTALPYRLPEFVENVFFHEVQVFNYPLFDYVPYSLSLASKMAQVALQENLDLLHVHYAIPHAASAYLAKNILAEKKMLPVITTLHGTDITLVGADPSYFDITKFSIEQSDEVTAVSEYLRNETIKRFAVRKPITVIPNFVDTARFHPHEMPPLTCLRRPGEKLLMHISNFRPVKRIDDIIDIFAGVARKIPSRLVLIGAGPEMDRVRTHVETLGLTDRVVYLGRQDDVSRLIPCADIYLLTSAHESFGLTALEAMSCGVPVIGTMGSGMDEFLGDNTAGMLFPVGDVTGMTEGCLCILTDPSLAEKMGQAGRKKAVDEYNEDMIVDRYEELYRNILNI
jgi:L-malate glycosyltransferase